jgi:hypothetical protein
MKTARNPLAQKRILGLKQHSLLVSLARKIRLNFPSNLKQMSYEKI